MSSLSKRKYPLIVFMLLAIILVALNFPSKETLYEYRGIIEHEETSTFDAPFHNVILLGGR